MPGGVASSLGEDEVVPHHLWLQGIDGQHPEKKGMPTVAAIQIPSVHSFEGFAVP